MRGNCELGAREGIDLGAEPLSSRHNPYSSLLLRNGNFQPSSDGLFRLQEDWEGGGVGPSGVSYDAWAAMEAQLRGGGARGGSGVGSWSTFDYWKHAGASGGASYVNGGDYHGGESYGGSDGDGSGRYGNGIVGVEDEDGATWDLAPPMRLEAGFLLINYGRIRWYSGDVVTSGAQAALVNAGTESVMHPQFHSARILAEPFEGGAAGGGEEDTSRSRRGALLTQWEDNDASVHADLGGFA